MSLEIKHLYQVPELYPVVAGWIYNEFWTDKPAVTAQSMEERLREATGQDSIPLSMVAFVNDEPVGTVNLIENDNPKRPELRPWLAALYVKPSHRGSGVGRALIRKCMTEAHRLGETQLYLGTDIPEYYEAIGATRFDESELPRYLIMKLDCQ